MVEESTSLQSSGTSPHSQDLLATGSVASEISSQSDENAFEVIAELAQSLQRAREFFHRQPDWYRKCYPSSCIPLTHDALQGKEDVEAIKRSMVAMNAIWPTLGATHDAWSWFFAQYVACDKDIRSLILRSGFLSLPDEILSGVLEFASLQENANGTIGFKDSVNASTKLSHVCSRFRSLILATPSHWDHISSSMDMEAINTCFSRCGLAGVEIVVSMLSFKGSEDIHQFWQIISREIHLWSSFAVLDQKSTFGFHNDHLLPIWASVARDVDAPLLSALAICYPFTVHHDQLPGMPQFEQNQEGLHFYSRWNLPNLQSMETENIIPVPFPGATSLTFLQIVLDFHHHERKVGSFFPTALATFLSSCPVLTELWLKVRHCDTAIVLWHTNKVVVEIPNITSLALSFEFCSSGVADSLFDLIHFTGLQDFVLACTSEEREPNTDGYDQDTLRVALRHCVAFTKLINLTLRVVVFGPNTRTPFASRDKRNIPISIPIPSLPHLRCLDITTCRTALESLPEGPALPSLKRLSFKDCKTDMDWFKTFCDQIRLQHLSGPPIKLAIEDCPWKTSLQETYKSMGSARKLGLHVED